MQIFIIGYMGAGKSHLGRELAKRLGFHFIDLDETIEQQAGKSVARIFEQEGEPAFRQLEAEVLRSTALKQNSVVATGGGTPCFFENMDWMNKNGVTIYFHASPQLLTERLRLEKAKRPLLASIPDEGLLAFIESKLGERAHFYHQSQLQFNVPGSGFEGLDVLAGYLARFFS